MDGRAPSSQETWDAFFSDFYLRVSRRRRLRATRPRPRRSPPLALSGCPAGGDLLDVACGFGRHACRWPPRASASWASTAPPRCSPRRGAAPATRAWPRLVASRLPRAAFADEASTPRSTSTPRSATWATRRTRRPRGDRARAATGRPARHRALHRDLLVRTFDERGWHMVGEGRLLLEQRRSTRPGVAQTTQTLVETERRARVAHVRRPRLHRDRAGGDAPRARASRRPRATATSTAARSRSTTRLVIVARR